MLKTKKMTETEIIKRGPPGPQGPPGPPGPLTVHQGVNGTNGINGTDGVNGTDFDPCVACLLDALVKLDSGAILVNVTIDLGSMNQDRSWYTTKHTTTWYTTQQLPGQTTLLYR